MKTNSIIINNTVFFYFLRISKKARHIQLQIIPGKGLELVIPYKLRTFNAEQFLTSKTDWINKHSNKLRKKKPQYIFLGKKIDFVHQYDLFQENYCTSWSNGRLIVSGPEIIGKEDFEIYSDWLREKAEFYIPRRAVSISKKFDFQFNKINIRNQKTRWGSCSSKGNLSFNYRLMALNKRIIDYVIVHELCHLKEFNHTKKFWKIVETIMPEYKNYKKELRGQFY